MTKELMDEYDRLSRQLLEGEGQIGEKLREQIQRRIDRIDELLAPTSTEILKTDRREPDLGEVVRDFRRSDPDDRER